MTPRRAEAADLAPAAAIWKAGWREAHEALVPPELTRIRLAEDFAARLTAFGDGLRVLGPVGAPLGLCAVVGDELNQLFVSPAARGTGAAAALIADAEARIAAMGAAEAWLDVAIGNDRARAFYEKSGWRLTETADVALATVEGPFTLRVWIFRKPLS